MQQKDPISLITSKDPVGCADSLILSPRETLRRLENAEAATWAKGYIIRTYEAVKERNKPVDIDTESQTTAICNNIFISREAQSLHE